MDRRQVVYVQKAATSDSKGPTCSALHYFWVQQPHNVGYVWGNYRKALSGYQELGCQKDQWLALCLATAAVTQLPRDRPVGSHSCMTADSKWDLHAGNKRGGEHNASHQVQQNLCCPHWCLHCCRRRLHCCCCSHCCCHLSATTSGNATTGHQGMLLKQRMIAGCASGAQRWADQDNTITTHKQVWYTAFLGLQGSTTQQDTFDCQVGLPGLAPRR